MIIDQYNPLHPRITFLLFCLIYHLPLDWVSYSFCFQILTLILLLLNHHLLPLRFSILLHTVLLLKLLKSFEKYFINFVLVWWVFAGLWLQIPNFNATYIAYILFEAAGCKLNFVIVLKHYLPIKGRKSVKINLYRRWNFLNWTISSNFFRRQILLSILHNFIFILLFNWRVIYSAAIWI